MRIGTIIRIIEDEPMPISVRKWEEQPIPAEKVWNPEKVKEPVPV